MHPEQGFLQLQPAQGKRPGPSQKGSGWQQTEEISLVGAQAEGVKVAQDECPVLQLCLCQPCGQTTRNWTCSSVSQPGFIPCL